MILYAEQLGWLASTPENTNQTRGERYLAVKADPPLPDVESGWHLIDAMRELGPIRSTGMGLVTPEWHELTAFCSAVGIVLDPWEMRTLKRMCSGYLSGLMTGKEPLSIPPMERGV